MKNIHIVVPQKLGIWATIAINAVAAIAVQIVFAVTLFPLFKMISNTKGLTSDGYYHLMVTAILVDCITTAFAIVVSERLFERTLASAKPSLMNLEVNRAMYFGVIGMLAVGFVKALAEGRMEYVWGFATMCIVLLFLGRYHEKFREARQGKWFPHTAFHYLTQQFVLFPATLWALGHILEK